MSPELIDLLGWENLLQRSRISDNGRFAVGYANPKLVNPNTLKKGDPHNAYMRARMAAHEARRLFPEIFLWEGERYGQQLEITEAA